jgi:hypothetical protein
MIVRRSARSGLDPDTKIAAVLEPHREHHAGAARCIMRRGNLPHTARESLASSALCAPGECLALNVHALNELVALTNRGRGATTVSC